VRRAIRSPGMGRGRRVRRRFERVALSGCVRSLFSRAARWGPTIIGRRRRSMPHFANVGSPASPRTIAVERYWTRFDDPLLDTLVDDAVHHNKDLATAAANLQAARAAGASRASISIRPRPSPAATRTICAPRTVPGSISTTASSIPRRPASTVVGARSVRPREAQCRGGARRRGPASAATLQDARVSVIAEVARDYFVLARPAGSVGAHAAQRRQPIQHAEADARPPGGGPGQRARYLARRSAVATTLASIPTLEASIATTMYRLSVLTGRQPAR
jgi:outer membrane protein TolC